MTISLVSIHKYHVKSPKYTYLSANSQKIYISRKLTLLQNTPILNHSGQNFQNFHAVVGIEEDDLGASMLSPSAILKICCF